MLNHFKAMALYLSVDKILYEACANPDEDRKKTRPVSSAPCTKRSITFCWAI